MLALGILAESSLYYLSEAELKPVIGPFIALVVLAACVYSLSLRADRSAPMELGVIYSAVVLIYGLYPLVVYLALGGAYTPLNDSRLFAAQPDPETVGRLGWYYALYMGVFILTYFAIRNGRESTSLQVTGGYDVALLLSVVICAITLRGTLLVADLLFSDRGADGYLASYTRFQHLPLIAQQVLTHASGIALFVQIVLIVLLAQKWAQLKWIIFLWLGAEFVFLLMGLGARTEFFVLALAALVARHLLFRHFRTGALVVMGVMLLVVFTVLGILRTIGDLSASDGGLLGIASTSEFDSLFANALDVERMTESGDLDRAGIFWVVYFGDLLALIPQQILGTEKASLASWYVTTYYPEYAEQGGGLAFGAIAESIAGTGVADLLWRGAIIGAIFGVIHRHLATRPITIWLAAIYVWSVCFSYQAFRASTFALLPMVFFRVLPAMILVMIVAALFRHASHLPSAAKAAIADSHERLT
jgi:hypothetical protein